MYAIFECIDVWRTVMQFVEFDDSCNLRETCSECYTLTKACEWEVADAYARNILHDTEFWKRALSRPMSTAMRQRTWHGEMLRIRNLERICRVRLTARDFYTMWDVVDAYH